MLKIVCGLRVGDLNGERDREVGKGLYRFLYGVDEMYQLSESESSSETSSKYKLFLANDGKLLSWNIEVCDLFLESNVLLNELSNRLNEVFLPCGLMLSLVYSSND